MALSEELPVADGVPVRVKVLGEQLIVFRDMDGRVDCYRRGFAVGATAEEAIARARAECLGPKLGEEVPPIAVE